jgi:hypothetical protein
MSAFLRNQLCGKLAVRNRHFTEVAGISIELDRFWFFGATGH